MNCCILQTKWFAGPIYTRKIKSWNNVTLQPRSCLYNCTQVLFQQLSNFASKKSDALFSSDLSQSCFLLQTSEHCWDFVHLQVPSISGNTLGLQSFFSKSRVQGFLHHQTPGGRWMAACFFHTAKPLLQALHAMAIQWGACHRTQAYVPRWHPKVPPGVSERAGGYPRVILCPAESHGKNWLIFVITVLHGDTFIFFTKKKKNQYHCTRYRVFRVQFSRPSLLSSQVWLLDEELSPCRALSQGTVCLVPCKVSFPMCKIHRPTCHHLRVQAHLQ